MITRIVKRYYCEHCRKGGMTKAIADHEKTCLKNPDRECWACKEFGLEQVPMPQLIEAANGGLSEIRRLTDCPACTLAAIIQEERINPIPDEDRIFYDYKDEMKQMREDRTRSFGDF